ncbi:hypothetical protein [Frigoriglobus tundricola]|uniref:Uncharacterized protein n=1 Tax=Frigoriglobus tundricola TaxID=2774151 RepID=A0A6M5YKH2_9BACT|nr:hypothetical protein [Frigoriglobus tundricola]QJW94527.1 hypothetical protein FTUN_2048 [Frigoriglobus tundricola]
MTDPNIDNANAPDQPQGFPFVTVAATLATLFVFLGLVVIAYRSPNGLDVPKADAPDAKGEPAVSAGAKLDEVRARNEAALNGVGAKMSQREARDALVSKLKGPSATLPFPTPEPVAPAPAPPKKDEPKGDTGKKP